MIYLGIDPGLSGAIAQLEVLEDGIQHLTVDAVPTIWRTVGKARRRMYALDTLQFYLKHLGPIALAYLEEQSARPGQGVVSMFSTGYGAGMWGAFLVAHHIPHVLVQPKRWRALVGLPSYPKGTTKHQIKSAVRVAANRRFPVERISLDHADAVMLAVAAALEHGAEKRVTG